MDFPARPIWKDVTVMFRIAPAVCLASLLVLYGGFMLRYLMVEMGQVSTWTDYAVQFDPQLLQRLMP